MSAKQSAACDRALRLVKAGDTPYRAALKTGISMSTIYRALRRHPEIPHPNKRK